MVAVLHRAIPAAIARGLNQLPSLDGLLRSIRGEDAPGDGNRSL